MFAWKGDDEKNLAGCIEKFLVPSYAFIFSIRMKSNCQDYFDPAA